MLQQTQVATVIPYFQRFIARFPTVADLAETREQDVLRLWQGLGYYSRARNLQRAAQKIIADFNGKVPDAMKDLLSLPGVGRYTAGAVASLAFGRRAPILDGNVARVLCRLDGIHEDPRHPAVREVLWTRAEQILPKNRLADFNSALMELGALVCTPRSPQCLLCPVQKQCQAFSAGIQEQIPPPKKTEPTPLLQRQTFCIRSGTRYLIEQRPAKGRWASLWQFITLEADSSSSLRSQFSLQTSKPKKIGQIAHALTHRRYEFEVFACDAKSPRLPKTAPRPLKWVTLAELADYPLPRPHLKMVELLKDYFTTPRRVLRYPEGPDSSASDPGLRSTSEPGVDGNESCEAVSKPRRPKQLTSPPSPRASP
jgi:A/G-specific adenine glycosylase